MAKAKNTSWIDPEALMRIRSLEMRAKVVVEGFFHGLHRSPFHGFSVEFSEYRQYSPGDDPRYLDWRLYARSDRFYVKRFEDETNLRCHLLVDLSRSMGYGSGSYSKGDYAKTLAATLAYFLWTQRDAVGVTTFDEGVVDYVPPRYRPGHLHRTMISLERALGGQSTDLGAPVEQIARIVTKRSLIVLISDLLAPIDQLDVQLGFLRSRGHEVVVMRVLDLAEQTFSFESPALFEDIETGKDLYVDPAVVRADYLERHGEHSAELERICAQLGIEMHTLITDQPIENALFDFLSGRISTGRGIARHGQVGRGGAMAKEGA